MSELKLYIKDRYDGSVRRYGESQHDSLRVVNGVLTYENLQNGDGSPYGYCFCNEDGSEDWIDNFPAEEYLHIGKTAVDAVVVVRCKDCKHSLYKPDGDCEQGVTLCNISWGLVGCLDPNDFCSYGKEKE